VFCERSFWKTASDTDASTIRSSALEHRGYEPSDHAGPQFAFAFVTSSESAGRFRKGRFTSTSTSMSMSTIGDGDWIKVDLHIHTLDDPKDVIDYSAHQLLEKAKRLGFGALAITLHDAVFDRVDVFTDAEKMGILLIPAAEMRLEGADVIVLNVSPAEIGQLRDFNDLRALREKRGNSIFTFAPHPFYLLGGSIGRRLLDHIDCFDGIELCHFHKGPFNPNWPATRVARRYGKPLVATSDAHRLHAFGRHYTTVPRPAELNPESIFEALRGGVAHLVSPPCTMKDLCSALYWTFFAHPMQLRAREKMGERIRGEAAAHAR
jgi:predicted metal-dependent phosphoesterase TrpH